MFEISSMLTIAIPEWRHWRRSGVFIINFGIFIDDFEQLNTG